MTLFSDGTERSFGYRYGPNNGENFDALESDGMDPNLMLAACKQAMPQHDPYAPPINTLFWQGSMGSCAGHAGAQVMQCCYGRHTGMWLHFSRGGIYIKAQDVDGISGDRGSTLHGVEQVLTTGICLESDWPYTLNYRELRNSEPPASTMNFRVRRSQRITRENGGADLAWDLLEAGACMQTGVNWNSSFDKPICNNLSTRPGGGHSTFLQGLVEGSNNARHDNSWKNWQGDGRNEWTKKFFADILKYDRWAVFIAYFYDSAEGPGTDPVQP